MELLDFAGLLAMYCFAALLGAMFLAGRERTSGSLLAAMAVAAVAACGTMGAAYFTAELGGGAALLPKLSRELRTLTPRTTVVLAVLAGSLAAPFWIAFARASGTVARLGVVGLLGGGVLLWALLIGRQAEIERGVIAQAHNVELDEAGEVKTASAATEAKLPDGFSVKSLAQVSFSPSCIALDEQGRLFVAGYQGLTLDSGLVARLDPGPTPEAPSVETPVLYRVPRPNGLALRDGDLYVSRAGVYLRATEGKVICENTGAVTRARDLDGDGVYEYLHDIVPNLPGGQLPGFIHQNNGLVFDAAGKLYVTVGTCSDHSPPEQEWEGVILQTDAEGTTPQVFARGLRNPFSIIVGPDQQLFCSDNDTDIDPGDRILHIVSGKHYGHPYSAIPGIALDPEGVTAPIARLPNAEGLAYVPPGAWPAGYDDALYVACVDNRIRRLKLTRDGETYSVATSDFLEMKEPFVSLAFDPKRGLYASTYATKTVFLITATGAVDKAESPAAEPRPAEEPQSAPEAKSASEAQP